MGTATNEIDIDRPADDVWKVVRDFGGLAEWMPGIEKCRVEGNSDAAVSLVKAWDAVTRWIYEPANKPELLAIAKKTMGATDKSAEAVYKLHVDAKSVSPSLRINEKYMQQFVENQKKAGAEGLPSDAMKYVDSSMVDKALKA